MIIEKKRFGKADGQPVTMFRIRNRNGMELSVMNYGACITALTVPDRQGRFGDVVLGYDDISGYVTGDGYIGACVGRYANRIAGAKFELDGVEFALTDNDNGATLHGGRGWSSRIFDFHPRTNALEFSLTDRAGTDGFPGNVTMSVKYTLTEGNALVIDYAAVSDADTVLNITNHSYFNLACEGDVLGHELCIAARFYTPVDSELIPTGEVLPVEGTDFDFRTMRKISKGYYDHNFVLEDTKPCARLYDPGSGRLMEIETDMPGLQLYCSNMLTDRVGKNNVHYGRYSGVSLETQFYPNSPNVPQFPSPALKAGQLYRHRTIYRFKTM